MSFDLSQLKFTVDTTELASALTMVDKLGTVVATLNKPLKTLGDNSKTAATEIDGNTKAITTNSKEAKTNQSILERQLAILAKMNEGWSKGQSSILAAGEASKLTNDQMQKLGDTLASQRRLIGGDPFDKSASGLTALTQGLGQAREGYRQLIEYTRLYEQLKAKGTGEEIALVALNRKETDNLYRDKVRMIEQYKELRKASFDPSDVENIKRQQTAYKDLKSSLKDVEDSYKQVATQKRPLDNIRTVDATKKADQLRYLARATSVQLGDIGVSLAGGQNPLTVFIQQGDQLRGVFNQVGASGTEMKKALSLAFSQIIVGFVEVAKVLGQFVVGAFVDTGKAIAKFATDVTFITPMLDYLRAKLVETTGETSGFVKAFDKVGSIVGVAAAVGIAAGIAGLIGMALAYKELLTVSKNLNVALATSGAAIAITKQEALAMSSALAGAKGTSMDVAIAITEIAKAGNLGKDTIAGITEVALNMQRYAGIAVSDTVTAYAKLAKDPIDTLTELGKATGRVTAEQIDNVRSLVEVGKMHEAVAEAIRLKEIADNEATASMIANMSPIQKLWDEVKDKIKDAKEEFFKLVNSTENVLAFSAVWQTLAVIVSEVWFTFKGMGKEIGGIAAQIAMLSSGDFQGAARIGSMMKGDADSARTAQDAYTKSIVEGTVAKKVDASVDTAGNLARREAIIAQENWEKKKKEYGANSRLDAARKAEEMGKEKSAIRENYNEMKRGIDLAARVPNADKNKIAASRKELDEMKKSLEYGVDQKYKPKKVAGADSAIKDEINSRQQEIENARKESEREAKMGLDRLNSEHKRALVNDEDYIVKKSEIEKKSLQNTISFFEKEKSIAAEKVNSKKEVQAIEGKILKATSDIKDKELEQGYALLELYHKQNMESINSNASQAEVADAKAVSLREQLKSEREAIDIIGLSTGAVLAYTVAKIKEKEADAASRANKLKEINPNEAKALLEQADAYNKLAQAKVDASFKEAKVRLLGTPLPTQYQGKVIGPATDTAARSNGSEQAIIDLKQQQLDLDKLQVLETGNVTEADRKRFADLEAEISKMQDRMTLTFKIAGLEDASTQLQGFVGALGSSAQANVDQITASINKMGAGSKGQFKQMLKDAQDQAAFYTRLKTAIGGTTTAVKTIAEAEKKYAVGSSERLNAQIGGYGDLAGAAAEYFDKGSTGYEVLKAAEMAFRAVQFALSVAAMVQDDAETGNSVANSLVQMVAGIGAGIAKMFEQSGWGGFIGAAALLALMAGLGYAVSGGGTSSGSFGTLGPNNKIDASGNKVKTASKSSADDTSVGVAAVSQEDAIKAANAAQIDAAANALNNLRIEARKFAGQSAELEKSLYKLQLAVAGNGIAEHELATKGMTEAQVATYNYNAALEGQISVLMDIANGTDNTSENMKKLAEESANLAIELKTASGDIAGAAADQRLLDTRGFTSKEVAVYDHNQALKAEIEAQKAAADAARAAAQAEIDLAKTRYELAGKLNVLLGRQTQLEYDRVTELAATTDDASIAMLKLIYTLEDLNTTVDNAYAKLERSINAEKEIATLRLKDATDLQAILKTAVIATTVEQTRAQAQAQLVTLLALAKSSGVLPSADSLKPALTVLAKPSEGLFATFVDYQRDFLKTANNISSMSDLADTQATVAQQTLDRLDAQLKTAKDQYDAIKGVDNSVKDVGAAIADFGAALAALANVKASSPTFNYAAPTPATSNAGVGGYGGGGYDTGGGAGGIYENIAGQDNLEIVAAYREYYDRNPDAAGYKNYVDSHLGGDRLMQAILAGSAGNKDGDDYKTAVSKGYDPTNPMAHWFHIATGAAVGGASNTGGSQGSFAVGINYVPEDMVANIHQGERILPAADNKELFARLRDPQENAAVLFSAVVRLTEEVQGLRVEARQTVSNTGDTSKMLKRLGGEEDILTVRTVA